ncbi:MAG: hypothetical protein A3F16_04620 [Deltaproteobacteria bacterium RIFCSPHIGHO2_12_FULL_43_9]|nr:MAG: hypothetical protein A3F16_04620 [Deltaproteobacteria bacterium RIFCSPHIGHO2_12_FULL_43_9]
MWYEREISDTLKRLVTTFPVVVVTGARQVGKTSLIRKLFPDYKIVSLDLPSNAEMAEKTPEIFLKKYPAPLIIDEVQYAPSLFRYLKHYVDQKRSEYGQYILTGSQKFTLMKEVSDSLAGRCAICELETLSVVEIQKGSHKENIESLILRGGFPELSGRPELRVEDFFNGYLATYLERDVRSLLQVTELRDFERFLRACASRSAQTLNKADLARDVGISPPTANKWLTVLNASNQVLLLEPWFTNKTKSLVKSPKIYLADTGLLCFLLNIKSIDDLISSPMVGAVWETFIFSEIRKRQEGNWNLWFWRDSDGLEVDFVYNRGGLFDLAEVKWSEHPDRSDADNLYKVAKLMGFKNVLSAKIVCRTSAPYPMELNDFTVNVESILDLKAPDLGIK